MFKILFLCSYETNQVKIEVGSNLSWKKKFEMYLKKSRCMKRVMLGYLHINKHRH